MAQIGKDYYEDLTADRLREILDALAAGEVPTPGPQTGRYASEPEHGLTTLKEFESGRTRHNASVELATRMNDTIKRIDGSEVPLVTPWRDKGANPAPVDPASYATRPSTETSTGDAAPAGDSGRRPDALDAPRGGTADDLKQIKGIGRRLEELLNSMGYYHFDQIAAWGPDDVAWFDDNLEGFKGRVSRDDWVDQARELAKTTPADSADSKT
jgi:NADH-quinone oxidoreductase subunit E